jgi:hypothetical protein
MDHSSRYLIHRPVTAYRQNIFSSLLYGFNSLAWPAYSVKEMFNEQFFFEQIPSIILGILRFDPTPDIGFMIACTFISRSLILTSSFLFERTKIMLL